MYDRPAAARPKDPRLFSQRLVEPAGPNMWRYGRGPGGNALTVDSACKKMFLLCTISLSCQRSKAATARSRCRTGRYKSSAWTRDAPWSSSVIKATTWWEILWWCAWGATPGAPASPPANVRTPPSWQKPVYTNTAEVKRLWQEWVDWCVRLPVVIVFLLYSSLLSQQSLFQQQRERLQHTHTVRCYLFCNMGNGTNSNDSETFLHPAHDQSELFTRKVLFKEPSSHLRRSLL